MVEALTLALALTGGELASRIIESIDGHPLLELCGVARSVPDLIRLLARFRPTVLLISPALIEELGGFDLGREEARALSSPLSFILSGPETQWEKGDLDGVFSQPLRYCGFVDTDADGAEVLFEKIKAKMELDPGERSTRAPHRGRGEGPGGGPGFIAMAGVKGGVGTTLVASCTAAVLAAAGRRVLLADLDCELSQLIHLLPPDGGKTMTELLPMAEDISWDLVRVSVHRHPTGFHLLPYGEGRGEDATPEGGIPEAFLRNLLFLFDTVIVDSPRPLVPSFKALLRRSPMVILVSLPDTLSARCAKKTAAVLRRAGLDHNHLRLVVNRCGSHHVLRPEELSSAAGIELLASLPQDERSGLDFSELGELPAENSVLARAVTRMACELGYHTLAVKRPPTRAWFNPLRRRYERPIP